MTEKVFSIYISAIIRAAFKRNIQHNLFGVEISKTYKKNEELIQRALSSIPPGDTIDLNLKAKSYLSPFTYLDQVYGRTPGEISIPIGTLKLERKYLFPGLGGVSVQSIFEQFRKKISTLPNELLEGISFFDQADILLATFQYYLGTIPYGKNENLISLYDYATLAAALAVCFQINQSFSSSHSYSKNTLLVKGDISGIQPFIFDVVSKGAAKSLKARSLRVQVISILASSYILNRLGLAPSNLLFIGGGNFYLLIPFSLKNDLEDLKKEMDQGELTRQHQNLSLPTPEKLHVYLGYTLVKLEDFENFGYKWQEVDEAVNDHRNSLYKSADFNDIFTPLPAINQIKRREVEQDYFKKITKIINTHHYFNIKPTQNGEWTSFTTPDLSPESEKLYKSDSSIPLPYSYGYLLFELNKNHTSKSDLGAGISRSIYNHDKRIKAFEADNQSIPSPFYFFVSQLPTWNQQSLRSWNRLVENSQKNGENKDDDQEIPRLGNTISFHLLAKKAGERTGTEKLGVLKMDVDDLGQLFQKRLGEDQKSISHTSAISRALKWFFEGYMNTLLARKLSVTLVDGKQNERYTKILEQYPEERFEDNLYIIFSGGDDFFLVGAWDITMEFALVIHKEFKQFTSSAASISAGLVIIDSKYPVNRFSDLVGEAEKDAKRYTEIFDSSYYGGPKENPNKQYRKKGRISIFGQELSWEDYERARSLRNTLYYLVSKKVKPESKSIIQKIRQTTSGFEEIQEKIMTKGVIDLPRVWHLGYALRAVKKENRDFIRKNILEVYEDTFRKLLMEKNADKSVIPPNPAWIAVGARWAEFMTRNIK